MSTSQDRDAPRWEDPESPLALTVTFQFSHGRDFFWKEIAKRTGSEDLAEVLAPEDWEADLRKYFGEAFGRRFKAAARAYGEDLRPPQFKLLGIRYGSLSLLLAAEIKPLADVLQAIGPEVMMVLLSTCAEEAFDDCVGAKPPPATVQLSSQLQARVSQASAKIDAAPVDASDKATWGLVAKKSISVPWLVPTLLAILVLGVAFAGVMQRSDELSRSQHMLLEILQHNNKDLMVLIDGLPKAKPSVQGPVLAPGSPPQ